MQYLLKCPETEHWRSDPHAGFPPVRVIWVAHNNIWIPTAPRFAKGKAVVQCEVSAMLFNAAATPMCQT